MPDAFESIVISDTDPSEAIVVDTTQDPVVEETPKVDPIAELSKAHGGIDLSGFTDEGSARTYIGKLTNLFTEAGQRAFAQQQQVPQSAGQFDYLPQQQAVEDDPLELEDVEDPPAKVTKTRVTKREKELERRLYALEQQNRQILERNIAHSQQVLANEAREALDGLGNPTYGVGGNRTMEQQIAAEVLLRRAVAIYNGAPQFGYNLRLSDAIRMAAGQTGPAAKPAPKKEVVGLEPRGADAQLRAPNLSVTSPGPGMGALPYGNLTAYTRDSAFQAAVKSLKR